MYKIHKYTTKLNNNKNNDIYKKKLLHYLTKYNFINNVQSGGEYNLNDKDSFFNYIKEKISTNDATEKRYLVLTFGPTGSGKTLARIVACKFIKDYFREENTIEEIKNSFVDTGVDEITYNKKINNQTVSDRLKENFKNIFGANYEYKNYDDFVENIDKQKFDDLLKSSYNIYRKNRADAESETLLYLSAVFKKNIIMEFATYDPFYFEIIIKYYCEYYNLIPVVIYPYIHSPKELFKRTLGRGVKEGRFVKCNGDHGIHKMLLNDYANHEEIIKLVLKKDNYLFVMYNTEMDLEHYNNFENGIFEKNEFDNYILKLHYKNILYETGTSIPVKFPSYNNKILTVTNSSNSAPEKDYQKITLVENIINNTKIKKPLELDKSDCPEGL